MENPLQKLTKRATQAVKNWWLLLVVGIACVAMGIVVFCYPGEAYLTLSILFGILMLLSGILEIVLYCSSNNYFIRSGISLIGGIIDVLLGLMLCCNVAATAILLPILLGIWLLIRSIQMIDFWSKMRTFNVPNAGWQVTSGVLLLLLALMVIFHPFGLGIPAVVAMVGCGLIVAGISLCATGIRLKSLHKFIKRNIIEDVEAETL